MEPAPQPLRDVLQGVLHANLFATWQDDLLRWEKTHPESAALLRGQIAAAALTGGMDPEYFKRLTGHWVTDQASMQAWFTQIYREYYGRAPELSDVL